jgi:hypothetical protein
LWERVAQYREARLSRVRGFSPPFVRAVRDPSPASLREAPSPTRGEGFFSQASFL